MLVGGEYTLDKKTSGSGVDAGPWMMSETALDLYLVHSSLLEATPFSGCKWCSDDGGSIVLTPSQVKVPLLKVILFLLVAPKAMSFTLVLFPRLTGTPVTEPIAVRGRVWVSGTPGLLTGPRPEASHSHNRMDGEECGSLYNGKRG